VYSVFGGLYKVLALFYLLSFSIGGYESTSKSPNDTIHEERLGEMLTSGQNMKTGNKLTYK
jgi:hypothetical protein